MKLIRLLLIVLTVIFLVGCSVNKETSASVKWINDSSYSTLNMGKKAKKAYKTINKTETNLHFVSLIASQKIEGTNYMYLAYKIKDEKIEWKIVTIYMDDYNGATLTGMYDFDYINYTNTFLLDKSQKDNNNWKIYSKTYNADLYRKYNKALDSLEENTYTPLVILGKNKDNKKEIALLCLEKKNNDYSFKIITVVKNKKDYNIKTVSSIDFVSLIN